jgi:hypothetical protein
VKTPAKKKKKKELKELSMKALARAVSKYVDTLFI